MKNKITLLLLVSNALADFNSHIYRQRFADSQKLLSEALPLIPKLQDRVQPVTKIENIDGFWNQTTTFINQTIQRFEGQSGLAFVSFAIVDYELDANSLYGNKTDFSVIFEKDKDFALHIDKEHPDLTMNLRKPETSLFAFPALS